ncbi:hypothetical protein LCGC14_1240160 [marine sediment metagenome]|uniref:Lin1244/Lin1753-like N-terminal domain-containing protein n=1 Tax=marine sediment metagenome TaxID=412755 RepID=A0A0F9NNA3_9ZZZZ
MARFPALPLWIDALSMDTDHLTNEEFGIYMRLIILMWGSPDCRIPNDDKWLAKHFHLSIEQIEEKVRPIIKEFCKTTRQFLTQGRLKDEWNAKLLNSDNQRTRANSRWRKRKKSTPAMPSIPSLPNPKNKDSENSSNDPVEKTVKGGDKLLLKSSTFEAARKIAPGYDIYLLEEKWRVWNYGKPVRDADKAFLGFVRKHVKENPI